MVSRGILLVRRAVGNHEALLEPIEEDQLSDLSPLAKKINQKASVRGEPRGFRPVVVVCWREICRAYRESSLFGTRSRELTY